MFIVFITLNQLNGQIGFQKAIKYNYSNAFIESIIKDDNLYFLQSQNHDLRGFYPTYLISDTLGNILLKKDNVDLKSRVGFTGQNKKLMTLGKSHDIFTVFIHENGIMVSHLTLDSLKLIFQNTYNYPGQANSYFPYNISISDDGNIYITGAIERQEFVNETFYFILKIDNTGNELFFKTYQIDNTRFGLASSYINRDGNFIIYGSVIEGIYPNSNVYAYTLEINPIDGMILKTNLFDKNKNLRYLVSLYENKNKTYSTVNFKVDYAISPYHLPHLDILDSNFKTIKSKVFGAKETQLTDQWPFQSAQDSLDNIYAATRSFVFKSFPQQDDSNAVEVLTLTKFNVNGDIVWETLDTVDFKALGSKYDRVSRQTEITSVNVSSSGSVYVSGYFSDLDDIFFIDTFTKVPYWAYDSIKMEWFVALKDTLGYDTFTQINRSVSFLFKYDKNGCRIANCHLTNSNASAYDERSGTFTIYPNPTSDVLSIKQYGITSDTDVLITDQTGTMLMKGYLRDGLNEVDVSHFRSGMYFVSIMQEGKVLKTYKFVKI